MPSIFQIIRSNEVSAQNRGFICQTILWKYFTLSDRVCRIIFQILKKILTIKDQRLEPKYPFFQCNQKSFVHDQEPNWHDQKRPPINRASVGVIPTLEFFYQLLELRTPRLDLFRSHLHQIFHNQSIEFFSQSNKEERSILGSIVKMNLM